MSSDGARRLLNRVPEMQTVSRILFYLTAEKGAHGAVEVMAFRTLGFTHQFEKVWSLIVSFVKTRRNYNVSYSHRGLSSDAPVDQPLLPMAPGDLQLFAI
mmetsp:Transcript_61219/g.131666  ORF Transcript_61219/g.131666 Transcript_61219/m.131666 type:complete len:100 (-) Transcript_61219:23-322(-)